MDDDGEQAARSAGEEAFLTLSEGGEILWPCPRGWRIVAIDGEPPEALGELSSGARIHIGADGLTYDAGGLFDPLAPGAVLLDTVIVTLADSTGCLREDRLRMRVEEDETIASAEIIPFPVPETFDFSRLPAPAPLDDPVPPEAPDSGHESLAADEHESGTFGDAHPLMPDPDDTPLL